MIFLYLVVAAVWFFFWLKGRLWAALTLPSAYAVLFLSSYNEPGTFTDRPWHDYPIMMVVIGISFIPMAIHKYRAKRASQLMNGVRFN